MLFERMYPSWTGIALEWLWPISITRHVDLPQLKALRTPLFAMNRQGTFRLSNMVSTSFFLFSLLWIEGSEKNIGDSYSFMLRYLRLSSKYASNHCQSCTNPCSVNKGWISLFSQWKFSFYPVTISFLESSTNTPTYSYEQSLPSYSQS